MKQIVQDDELSETVSSMDNATHENLKNLVTVGETLLKKRISRMNMNTGKHEHCERRVTNEEELIR